MKNPWIVISIIVAVLVGGSVWYSLRVEKTYNEGITVADHIKGGVDAKVTLVEYSDFQCPACGQFEPVVEEVLGQYGDQIKFEYKNFPLIQLHPFAESAAVAAEAAAQQGKYFEFHDMLFAKQGEWTKGISPSSFYSQYAKELGMDVSLFARHQRSSILRDKVKADYKAAVAMGLTSTPTFYLNGQKMTLTTLDEFKAQIERAVNPNANFNVTAGDETLKMVPVADDSGTNPDATQAEPAALPAGSPAVNFGI
jgi:protein-disulfide isomerase